MRVSQEVALARSGEEAERNEGGHHLGQTAETCPLQQQRVEGRCIRRWFLWDGRFSVNGDEADAVFQPGHVPAETRTEDPKLAVRLHAPRLWFPEGPSALWNSAIGPVYHRKVAFDFELRGSDRARSLLLLIHERETDLLVFKSVLDVEQVRSAPDIGTRLTPGPPGDVKHTPGAAYGLQEAGFELGTTDCVVRLWASEQEGLFDDFRDLSDAPVKNVMPPPMRMDMPPMLEARLRNSLQAVSAEMPFTLPSLAVLWRNTTIHDGYR